MFGGVLQVYRSRLVAGAVLLLPLASIYAHGKPRTDTSPVEQMLLVLTAPASQLTHDVLDGVRDLASSYLLLTQTEARNQQLQQENQILLGEALRARAQLEELRRVKALCGFREQNDTLQTVPARVVGRDVSQFFQVVRLRLDITGNKDVREGQAVITHDGVVGRIDKLSDAYADVMLVTDARSEVHANVPGKGVVGSVKGGGKRNAFTAQFSYLDSADRTQPLAPGDAVWTTGHDRVFPPGLEIGHIAGSPPAPSGQYQQFTLAPAVTYANLEEVLIVVNWRKPTEDLPPAAAVPPVAAALPAPGAVAPVATPPANAAPTAPTGKRGVDPANTPDAPP